LYFSPNCGEYHPYIKTIELRAPGRKGKPGGLIIIEFSNGLGITGEEVLGRFGEISDLVIPYPEQPQDDPLYYVYKFDWGDLSFGISRDKSAFLVSAILDAYKSH